MDSCCNQATVSQQQRSVLIAVLAINAAMFCVEFGAGLVARSTALLGDSLDMLGDTLVYGFSMYVLGTGSRWRASSALTKGLIWCLAAASSLRPLASSRQMSSRDSGDGLCRTSGPGRDLPDVDAHCECTRGAGARISYGPTDQPYRQREYEVMTDPEGHRWWFATPNAVE